MMKKLLIGLGVLGVLFLGIVAVAPFSIPIDQYRAELIDRAKQATGRDLRIGGDVYFAAFPHLAFEVEGVTLSNPPGMSSPDLLRADRLEVRLKLLPLLLGRLEIRRLILMQPVVALEIAADGTPNWSFEPSTYQDMGLAGQTSADQAPPEARPPLPGIAATAPAAPALPMAPALPPPSTAAAIAISENAIQALHLNDVRLIDGTITYIDRRKSDPLRALSHVRLALSLADLRQPFNAQGEGTWRQRSVNMKLAVANPAALLSGDRSAIDLDISTKLMHLGFKGDLSRIAPLTAVGSLDVKVPSLRDWSDWMDTSWRFPGTGPGALNLAGSVDVTWPRLRLTSASARLDDIRATGQLSVDNSGARPALQGLLDMDRLDIDAYLPPLPGRQSNFDNFAMAQAEGTWTSVPPPSAGAGSPAVPGMPRPRPGDNDWSSQPIDMTALGAFNADLSLSAGQIYLRGIRLGRSVFDLHLHDRRLDLELTRFAFYDGFGKGTVLVNADTPVPGYQARFNLTEIQLSPLLRDMAGFDGLSGVGTIDLALTSAGGSERDIVAKLNGSGGLTVANGGLRGVNLVGMVRSSVAVPTPLGRPTDVSLLTGASASFAVQDGVLHSRDVVLRTPTLTVTGTGTAGLAQQNIALRLIPHGAPGIVLNAVDVSGPWDKPTYRTATGAPPAILHPAKRPTRPQTGALHFLRRLFGGD